jgi:hypothetical protein
MNCKNFVNMVVCPHATEVMSASVTKVVHKSAAIKCKCRKALIPKPKRCDTVGNRRYTRHKTEL